MLLCRLIVAIDLITKNTTYAGAPGTTEVAVAVAVPVFFLIAASGYITLPLLHCKVF